MKNIKAKIITIATCLAAISCSTGQEETIKLATLNARYDNPNDSTNNWTFRKDSVADFITNNSIDIIGLQEILDNQFDDLRKRLPEYGVVGVGREDGNRKGEYAPIFYKKDRFEIIEGNTFWLSQYPDSIGFIGWDGACTRIATWAKLRDIETKRILLVMNTHFDHVGTEARRQGAHLIIKKIKEIADGTSAVLTGDFNIADTAEAYRIITESSFCLTDAHKSAKVTGGPGYTFHNFGKVPLEEREKIDFIFVTPDIEVSESYIHEDNNSEKFYISDHNPQIVSLKIK